MKCALVLAAAALGFGMFAIVTPSADAATITVSVGQSIQHAIDSANPGDTISIGPGLFRETPVVDKDRLRIVGHNTVVQPPAGSTSTFVMCVSTPPACPVPATGAVTGVTIAGITVQKSANGAGLLASGVVDLTLSNDHAIGNGSAGFALVDASNPTLILDVATGNTSGGFAIDQTQGVTLTGNQATGNRGYGFLIGESEDFTLRTSIAKSNCLGLVLFDDTASHPGASAVSGDAFTHNTASCVGGGEVPPSKGTGAVIVNSQNLLVTHNVVQANGHATTDAFTGGLVVIGSPLNAHNVFSANALKANVPVDIRADSTDPTQNSFVDNICSKSVPTGLC